MFAAVFMPSCINPMRCARFQLMQVLPGAPPFTTLIHTRRHPCVWCTARCRAAAGFATPPISQWGKPKDEPAPAPASASGSAAAGTGGAARPAPPAASSGGGFMPEAELGAEIAAIAKSLVQRALAPSAPAPPAPAPAPPAPAPAPAAAAPGKPAAAPPAKPSAPQPKQQQKQQAGAASKPPAGAPASGRQLRLVAAGVTLPHVDKVGGGTGHVAGCRPKSGVDGKGRCRWPGKGQGCLPAHLRRA